MWIESDKQFAEFCADAYQDDALGIDLEFHGEGRYTPQLCLVQLASRNKLVAVDPFKVNLSPLTPLLAAPQIRKVFHAATQDLVILQRESGVMPVSVFDTQVAAAFLGFGESIGYGGLVVRMLNIPLDKRQRFTDWTQRPLAPAQIEYAINDVRHLLPIYDLLSKELSSRGRFDWVMQVCSDWASQIGRPRTPETAYLRLGKLAGLSRRELGVLRELAAWREETARSEGRPIGSILSDDALRQICFALPKNETELRQVRGLRDSMPRSFREGILAAIQRARALPEGELPQIFTPREPAPATEALASLLSAVVRARSIELELAPTLIATRDELSKLAAWAASDRSSPLPDSEVLTGWRAEAVGNLLHDLLLGKVTVRVDMTSPGGIIVEGLRTEDQTQGLRTED
ncbi:MAG: ribonuclease D [Blastocatellia bacterium]|nr:ribonuclease D [Blastocatellia bacterium]